MSAPSATPDAPTQVQEPVGGLDRMAADVPLPAALLGLLGVYLLGVGSGLYTAEGSDVPLWWPAAGLAVAMLLLTPPRSQWLLGLGVALATAAGAYTGGDHSLVSAVGFGVSSGSRRSSWPGWSVADRTSAPRCGRWSSCGGSSRRRSPETSWRPWASGSR